VAEPDVDRVSEVWNQSPERTLRFWAEHPLVVAERLNRMVSGRPEYDSHQWFIERLGEMGFSLPIERCLTLGCGFGDLERGYSQYGFTRHHEGVDIAAGAIESASASAREAGLDHIEYKVADLNTANFDADRYDVIMSHQSVHHVENLEHLVDQVFRALKPGGVVILNEYVGANRLQVPDQTLAFADGMFALLPDRYLAMPDGSHRRKLVVPSAEEVAAYDPSEAPRSEDIVRVFSQSLDLFDRRAYGGNVIHFGLEGILGNFCSGDPRDDEWLRWIFAGEDRLLDEGTPSDFEVLVFRRPA